MGHFVVGQLLTQFVEWHLSMLVEVVGIVGRVGRVIRVGSFLIPNSSLLIYLNLTTHHSPPTTNHAKLRLATPQSLSPSIICLITALAFSKSSVMFLGLSEVIIK